MDVTGPLLSNSVAAERHGSTPCHRAAGCQSLQSVSDDKQTRVSREALHSEMETTNGDAVNRRRRHDDRSEANGKVTATATSANGLLAAKRKPEEESYTVRRATSDLWEASGLHLTDVCRRVLADSFAEQEDEAFRLALAAVATTRRTMDEAVNGCRRENGSCDVTKRAPEASSPYLDDNESNQTAVAEDEGIIRRQPIANRQMKREASQLENDENPVIKSADNDAAAAGKRESDQFEIEYANRIRQSSNAVLTRRLRAAGNSESQMSYMAGRPYSYRFGRTLQLLNGRQTSPWRDSHDAAAPASGLSAAEMPQLDRESYNEVARPQPYSIGGERNHLHHQQPRHDRADGEELTNVTFRHENKAVSNDHSATTCISGQTSITSPHVSSSANANQLLGNVRTAENSSRGEVDPGGIADRRCSNSSSNGTSGDKSSPINRIKIGIARGTESLAANRKPGVAPESALKSGQLDSAGNGSPSRQHPVNREKSPCESRSLGENYENAKSDVREGAADNNAGRRDSIMARNYFEEFIFSVLRKELTDVDGNDATGKSASTSAEKQLRATVPALKPRPTGKLMTNHGFVIDDKDDKCETTSEEEGNDGDEDDYPDSDESLESDEDAIGSSEVSVSMPSAGAMQLQRCAYTMSEERPRMRGVRQQQVPVRRT